MNSALSSGVVDAPGALSAQVSKLFCAICSRRHLDISVSMAIIMTRTTPRLGAAL